MIRVDTSEIDLKLLKYISLSIGIAVTISNVSSPPQCRTRKKEKKIGAVFYEMGPRCQVGPWDYWNGIEIMGPQTRNNCIPLSERVASFGIIGDQLRASLKPLNAIVL